MNYRQWPTILHPITTTNTYAIFPPWEINEKKKYTVDNQGTVYISIQGVVNFYEIANRLDETSRPNISLKFAKIFPPLLSL